MIRPIRSKSFYPLALVAGLLVVSGGGFGLYYFNLNRIAKIESSKFNKVLDGNYAYLNQLKSSRTIYGDMAKCMILIQHYKGQVSISDNEFREYSNLLSLYPNFKHIVNLVGVLQSGVEPYPGYANRTRSIWGRTRDSFMVMSLKTKITHKLIQQKYAKAICISRPDLLDTSTITPDSRCTLRSR